jgi:hypothetical protein
MRDSMEDTLMTASCGGICALVMRMQGRYLETPGLTLTPRDAQRRFGVDETTCEAVLAALVDAGVLTTTPEGAYARRFPRLAPRVRARGESGLRHGGTRRFAEHAA